LLSIHLHNLQFFAHHGLYDEEKILGNTFEINVDVELHKNERVEKLNETINYVQIYQIIKKRMKLASPLLETVAYDLVDEIKELSTQTKSIYISIKKLNPPIENFIGSVGVSIKKEF
jgi:7,8-dihydroneopterin aldolase/epimerase/oxygenase